MKERTNKGPILPLIRLNLIQPFLEELRRRKIDPSKVLTDLSVSSDNLSSTDVFVSAPKMYLIAESLSKLSGDPFFGVHVGSQLDPMSWSPLKKAAEHSTTVGELLLRFMESAIEDENSVIYSLNSTGNRSVFSERRITDGGLIPSHNDGFTIAFLITLIRRAVGEMWNGKRVTAHVCDPSALPDNYHGIRTAITDTLGVSISFPTKWLIQPQSGRTLEAISESGSTTSVPSQRFIKALHVTLQPHIHEFDLGVDRVAQICGINKRTLSRRLQVRGTNLRNELKKLRMSRARKKLSGTGLHVSEIAIMVGYSNPAVFSRAFKQWTGVSPRQYRAAKSA